MKLQRKFHIGLIITFLLIVVNSCTKDYLIKPVPPTPKVGVETDSLEANFTSTSLSSVNATFWKESDFVLVDLQDLSTQNLYDEDGCLNLTGTYNGLSDYNNGNTTTLTLKAAYDSTYIYIYAEWDDDDLDISPKWWLWNGPEDPLKPDSTNGWTSQRNDDKIAFAFDINGATTSAGPFASVGCAASCHSSGGSDVMAPESGKVDLWNWSLALSEPLGYAFDMVTDLGSGMVFDAGQPLFERNDIIAGDNRSGFKYEWDGVSQDITKPLGGNTILDPGLLLLNKIEAVGNPSVGSVIYVDHDKGCEGCHGAKGTGFGPNGDGPAFNTIDFARKFSRATFYTYASSTSHEGSVYFNRLNATERNNLTTYIWGLAGIPGYYLVEPLNTDESITDITTNSNKNLARVDTKKPNDSYKVMFKRKLDTGNPDDIVFNLTTNKVYPLGVALMDNDGKNHVGSLLEQLIFIER